VCQANVICSKGSTTGLALHLKKHQAAYDEFLQKKQEGVDFTSENSFEAKPTLEVEQNVYDSTSDAELNLSNYSESTTDAIQPEKLVLAGSNFQNDLMNVFKELSDDEDFTNVTLVTDGGKTIKAHKVVLSAFSPFFKSLLVNNVHQHPLLYLRGVQYEDLRAVLDFIYLGQTKVEMHQVNQFMELASDLQIKGLRVEPGTDGGSKKQKKTKMVEKTNVTKYAERDGFEGAKNAIKNENTSNVEPLYFYACHLCEYQAEIKRNLIRHIQITHTEGIHTCNLCDYFAENSSSLSEHKAKSHATATDLVMC